MKKAIKILAGLAFLLFCPFGNSTLFAQEAIQLSDPEVASIAVIANLIDVHYGEIVLEKSDNADIRQFAQTMINDHNAIIKQAAALAKKLGVTPKDNAVTQQLLNGEKKTIKMLKTKEGTSFNKAYIDNEVAYHKAVISTIKDVLIPQTENGELKAFLQSAMPLLQGHLEHAEMVQSKMK